MKKVLSIFLAAGIATFVACGPSAEEKAAMEKQNRILLLLFKKHMTILLLRSMLLLLKKYARIQWLRQTWKRHVRIL